MEGREYEWIWDRVSPNNGEPWKPCNDDDANMNNCNHSINVTVIMAVNIYYWFVICQVLS